MWVIGMKSHPTLPVLGRRGGGVVNSQSWISLQNCWILFGSGHCDFFFSILAQKICHLSINRQIKEQQGGAWLFSLCELKNQFGVLILIGFGLLMVIIRPHSLAPQKAHPCLAFIKEAFPLPSLEQEERWPHICSHHWGRSISCEPFLLCFPFLFRTRASGRKRRNTLSLPSLFHLCLELSPRILVFTSSLSSFKFLLKTHLFTTADTDDVIYFTRLLVWSLQVSGSTVRPLLRWLHCLPVHFQAQVKRPVYLRHSFLPYNLACVLWSSNRALLDELLFTKVDSGRGIHFMEFPPLRFTNFSLFWNFPLRP